MDIFKYAVAVDLDLAFDLDLRDFRRPNVGLAEKVTRRKGEKVIKRLHRKWTMPIISTHKKQ